MLPVQVGCEREQIIELFHPSVLVPVTEDV
jgi:hypothetical protein